MVSDRDFVLFRDDCGRLDDMVFVVPVPQHHVVLYLETFAFNLSYGWIWKFGFGASSFLISVQLANSTERSSVGVLFV